MCEKHVQGKKRKTNLFKTWQMKKTDGNLENLAQVINSFFQSVSNVLVPLDSSLVPIPPQSVPVEYILSVEDVEKKTCPNTYQQSPRSWSFAIMVLQDFAEALARPTCAIMNSSLRESYLPQIWKSGSRYLPNPKSKPSKVSWMWSVPHLSYSSTNKTTWGICGFMDPWNCRS